ncbi:RNA polymerase sigma factor [Micromonospora endolithica]|nr:sigma-70 family RNA polymerase sigma factor [Micromonospora endolithica]TWJ21315.1 RNA polymerase sigma factor (sigma-70 family) [Micromonospora endolithica]
MPAQDDTALVEAVRRGERAGLEGMYRRYADRLYTYARSVLREPEAAADAVHDAFLTAGQRIGQLREPARLRPWLYAIVRNECHRQLRDRSRSLPLEKTDEPVADIADPGTGVNAEQVRDLVHAAADALNPGDREVVHLAIRHDLSSADIGAALGVPANHAHARLSRARSQLERAMGALLVARAGARDCPTLAGLIDGWQGRLTPTLRKRVSRHIEGCAVCGLLQREQFSPAALLSAYTAPAFLAITDAAWPRLAGADATDAPGDAATGSESDRPAGESTPASDPATDPVADVLAPGPAAAGGEPSGPGEPGPSDGLTAPTGGAPVRDGGAPPGEPAVSGGARVARRVAAAARTTARAGRDRRRRRVGVTSALLVLLAALGSWALAPTRPAAVPSGSGQPVSGTAGTPARALAGTPAAPAVAPRSSGTPTAARTRAAAPRPPAGSTEPGPAAPAAPEVRSGGTAPAPTGTAPAPTIAPRPVAAPFTVSATARVRCGAQTYAVVVQATGSATLVGAEVRWATAGGRTATRAMTVDGSTARVTVGRLRASAMTWSVRATSIDGRTAQSPTYPVADPCVRPG